MAIFYTLIGRKRNILWVKWWVSKERTRCTVIKSTSNKHNNHNSSQWGTWRWQQVWSIMGLVKSLDRKQDTKMAICVHLRLSTARSRKGNPAWYHKQEGNILRIRTNSINGGGNGTQTVEDETVASRRIETCQTSGWWEMNQEKRWARRWSTGNRHICRQNAADYLSHASQTILWSFTEGTGAMISSSWHPYAYGVNLMILCNGTIMKGISAVRRWDGQLMMVTIK